MGQDALVDEQVRSGERLLAQLAAVGFEITGAFWAQVSEEGVWFLYLASPVVDVKGLQEGYRDLLDHLRQLDYVGVGPFEIRLVSPSDTMAAAAAEVTRLKPGAGPFAVKNPKPYPGMTRFGGSRLGGVDVEGVLIYPPQLAPTP